MSFFRNTLKFKVPNQSVSCHILVGKNSFSTKTPINYTVFSFSSTMLNSNNRNFEENIASSKNYTFQKPNIG